MSVRRDAVSVNTVNGAGLIKSALFWVSMLTASFLLGFLVVAPLTHLVRGRADAARSDVRNSAGSGESLTMSRA